MRNLDIELARIAKAEGGYIVAQVEVESQRRQGVVVNLLKAIDDAETLGFGCHKTLHQALADAVDNYDKRLAKETRESCRNSETIKPPEPPRHVYV